MSAELKTGLRGHSEELAARGNLASDFGSGSVDVYATPAMIALMEAASLNAVDPLLDSGFVTVGVHVDASHIAATPPGMKVRAEAELIEIKGRQLIFAVEAHDEKQLIGKGTHRRAIVELAPFLDGVKAK